MTKEIKVPVQNLLSGKKEQLDDSMLVNGGDIEERKAHEDRLKETNSKIKAVRSQAKDPVVEAQLLLDKVNSLLALGRKKDIWKDAQTAFGVFIENQCWEQAAEICDIMYLSEQEDAIKALMHGAWLAVSFPVDPELTLGLMEHIVDETPPNADGAAVAAATAHYIVSLRASDEDFENLNFLSVAMLGKVAEAHSQVKTQEEMNEWMEKLKLNDPEVFLPRLGMVLNAVVEEGQWWFDRDELRKHFPQ